MSFCIAVKPTYPWPVKVSMQDGKGGFTTSTFKAIFARQSVDEIEEIKSLQTKEALKRVLVGWSDLVDEDGVAVEFNDENFERLISILPALKGLVDAFWESLAKAKEKN